MVPYIEIRAIDLGPLHIHPFGIMIGCTLLTWLVLVLLRAGRLGLDSRRALHLLECILIFGLIGAMLLPLVVSGRRGYSSFAGVFGSLLGAVAFLWVRKVPTEWRWRYLDLLAYVFPFGWAFLRLGCTLRHEHPGRLTDFWLAVQYPGGARYDLGLLEMLLSIAVACAFAILGRKPRPPGFYVRWMVVCGPLRILLDLLRENPPRYFGWTADQLAGLVLTAVGVWVFVRTREFGFTGK